MPLPSYFHRMEHPHIRLLLQCIELEEKEQAQRYRLDQAHTLKQLKAEGLALHPLIITRKSFGYLDFPEISFRLPFPPEVNLFRDGAAIECFIAGEEPVKGMLMNLDGRTGEFRLYAPDFPDWIEEDGTGIKLAPDTRTSSLMKKGLEAIGPHKESRRLFERLHGSAEQAAVLSKKEKTGSKPEQIVSWFNERLNQSQQEAVEALLANDDILVVHGPPGTGKTTTLVEGILQLIKKGEKVLVAAPSNTAVDHISKELLRRGVNLLRVGNTGKVEETVFAHTPEGKMASGKALKEIKQLKVKAEEFRRMALKYKRSFGKAEREQRNLLFQEVRNIRAEIRQLQEYHESKMFEEAQVIAGTPVGLKDAVPVPSTFGTLVLDEAGQCIEPLAWCIFPLAQKIVLAGDHWQLPPTVLSHEAARLGLNRSVLEAAIPAVPTVFLLDTQYRMRESIAGFSSRYFYNGLLQTTASLANSGIHLTFIDTAGSGFQESPGPDGVSLLNEGELQVVQQLLEKEIPGLDTTALISPYAGQVAAARETLPPGLRISTIDSFQGQEKNTVIVSLVRSNEDGDIGFLKDYRRMNVAITRAKEQLYVIGDSATIGADPFYSDFLGYVEQYGAYRTVWEFDLLR